MTMRNPNKNWNCDSDKCRYGGGEVRVYSISDVYLLLCNICWVHENSRRRTRGRDTVKWNCAEVYKPEDK
jgi:hypothetical protein